MKGSPSPPPAPDPRMIGNEASGQGEGLASLFASPQAQLMLFNELQGRSPNTPFLPPLQPPAATPQVGIPAANTAPGSGSLTSLLMQNPAMAKSVLGGG